MIGLGFLLNENSAVVVQDASCNPKFFYIVILSVNPCEYAHANVRPGMWK